MRDDQERDRWLADAITSNAGLLDTAGLLVHGGSYGADGPFLARRYLEAALETGADGISEWVLRDAASRLTGDAAMALRAVADTSGALSKSALQWRGLYLGRPQTAPEIRARRLLSTGQVVRTAMARRGADGALMEPAWLYAGQGRGGPAVVLNTHAGTAEIVTGFENEREQADWLSDRAPAEPVGAALPLVSCLASPRCRAVAEETVLAGLIQAGDPDREISMQFGPGAFATYSRSAICRAWSQAADGGDGCPDVAPVRAALESQLLRAPYEVAVHTGWPYGEAAVAYFDRLAATPVDPALAVSSARSLAREDAEARTLARPGTAAMSLGRAPRRIPQPRPDVYLGGAPGIPGPRDPGDSSPGIAPGQGGR